MLFRSVFLREQAGIGSEQGGPGGGSEAESHRRTWFQSEAEYRRSRLAGAPVSKGRSEVAGIAKRRGSSRNRCHPRLTPARMPPAERMRMRPIELLPEASRCERCGASELQQTLGENR